MAVETEELKARLLNELSNIKMAKNETIGFYKQGRSLKEPMYATSKRH